MLYFFSCEIKDTQLRVFSLSSSAISTMIGAPPCDRGMVGEWSTDPLEIPLGSMTRARAKRFKEVRNVLIRDAQVEEAHVFNSKEETKMVHVIKVNLNLDQELGHF